MENKLKIILAVLGSLIAFLAVYKFAEVEKNPENAQRNMLSESFSRECFLEVRSNEFLYDTLSTKGSMGSIFDDPNSKTSALVEVIPKIITLEEFLKIRPNLVRNHNRLQVLPITNSVVVFRKINQSIEEWNYTFEHSEFEFDCKARVKLEYGVPIITKFNFEIIRSAKNK